MTRSESTLSSSAGALGVSRLDSAAEQGWEEFVARRGGSLFHTLAWRDAIRATFSHPEHYLVANRGDSVVGVLPMTQVSSVFFGTTLVSVPFGVYGGLLADDASAAEALVAEARRTAERLDAKYVELRHLDRSHVPDLPSSGLYFTFVSEVPDTAAGCLERIPRKARAEVRKAIGNPGLTFEEEGLDLAEFHHLFSLNKRRLGSPLFPSSLFWHLRARFRDDCVIHTVRHEGALVSTVMSFIHGDTIMPYYSGSLEEADARFRASNFLYYKLMEWASERGLKRFDFGRSREDTGAFHFKKHQGFEPTRLSYDYILVRDREIPRLNPSNPKYRAAQALFRRLPLFAAQKLGSWLVKRAPF